MHGMQTMLALLLLFVGVAELARQFLNGQTKAVMRSSSCVSLSQGRHQGIQFLASMSFLTKLFAGGKQRGSEALSTTLLEDACTANFLMERLTLSVLPMQFLQTMLHLRKLRPCLGLLETEGLADDMFLGKRLLCFMSHP